MSATTSVHRARDARPAGAATTGRRGRDARPAGAATRTVLAVAGVVAVGVGAGVTFVPVSFGRTYGAQAPVDVATLSDLRGSGALVRGVGVLLLTALARPHLAAPALLVGGGAYLAYAAGRAVGLPADGAPGGGTLAAGLLEVLLGVACVVAWARLRTTP